MKKIYCYLLIFSLFSINNIFSQGASCGASTAFCAGGSALTFPNSTGTTAQTDVNYDCLGTQPNPAWFYMQIGLAGNIDFHISQVDNGGTPRDVDFIAWGPFTTPACGPANLNPSSEVACSYSIAADEFFTIPNAQVGEIYVVLLTNYHGTAGHITLTQTNTGQASAGATDCNIICPLDVPNQVICSGGQAILTANIVGATSYQWSSSVTGPIAGNTQSITVTQPGTYTVVVNKPGCVANSTDTATVSFNAPPPINPPSNLSQCNNIPNFNLTQNSTSIFTGTGLNPGDYDISYHHTANDAQLTSNPIANPAAYAATCGETIYLSITDNSASSSGCTSVFPFTIGCTVCTIQPAPTPNLVVCDDPSNDGIATFDFTPQTAIALGGNPPANYTVTYHLSQAAADADTGAINPINSFNNTSNPQTIYIRLEENANHATYGTGNFQLIVNPLPTATISGTTAVCQNTPNPSITFTGANGIAPYTFTYLDPALVSHTITTTVGNSVTLPVSTSTAGTFTYQLVSVSSSSTPACSQPQVGSATITVNPIPTATITGTTAVCQNTSNPVITWTGANGTAPYTFTYLDPASVSHTITTTVGNSVTLPVSTATAGTFTYQLVSVLDSGSTLCSPAQVGSATVTVNPIPTATISGTTTVCQNSSSPSITFTGANGIAPYTFTYLDPALVSHTITTTVGNSVTLPVSTSTAGTFTYQLVSVSSSSTPACSQPQVGSATITVNPLPTATITGTTAVCQNTSNPVITWTGANGTAPYTFTYLDPAAVSHTITTTVGNSVTLPVSTATAGTFTYQLVSVSDSGSTLCSQAQVGSATVTVNPLPTATISGTTTVCQNSSSPSITFTGANGIAPYTFTYLDPALGSQTITTTVGNSVTLPVSTTIAGTFTYQLVSVAGSGTPVCSQPQVGSVTVTINPLSTATISGTTAVCQNAPSPLITFTGSNGVAPYTFTYLDPSGVSQTISTTSGNSVTLPVSTSTGGVFTYQLVSVSSSTTPACSQPQLGSVTITVNTLPTATISGTTSVCLNSTSPQISFTGANGTPPYTFTYSINNVLQPTVQTSGGNNVLLINAPTSTAGTFIYDLKSVQDASSTTCSQVQTGSATITVNVAPTINTPTDYVVCDDSLNNDGIYCFTLTTKDIEISTNPNVVITYHETPTNAQTGANPLTSPYCNINNAGFQTIYVRAYNLGSPSCYSTTSFNLIVNPIPLPNPNITDYLLCDINNPGDGVEVFDLGTKSLEVANGQLGVTVSYYETLADAQAQTNALPNFYSNISNPQKIWINISDNITGCNTTGFFNLIVNPLPVAVLPQPIFQCSNGISPTAVFNLTVNEGTVTGGVTGVTVTYYHSLADAQTLTNPIPTPQTYLGFDTEIVYIRVENNATGCYATTTQLLRVTQGPVAITPTPLQICDPNNDGFGTFNLTDATNEITGTPPGAPLPLGVSVTYHETPDDALIGANPLPSSYTNIQPNTQTIYVRVFYTLTGCANYVQLQLIVNKTPVATQPTPYALCDYTGAVGFETFDLTTKINEILGSINPALTSVSFYTSQPDADAGTNAITSISSYVNASPNTQTLYVRVETIATGCYDVVTLQLVVNPIPNSLQPNYPQYSLCDVDQSNIGFETFDLGSKINDILLGQTGMTVRFYISLGDAQNGTNEITNLLYQNQIQYVQTLGISITNNATGCSVISTMDIRVEPLPSLIPPTQPYTLCDDDQDGFTTFDLTSLLPGLLNSITTYTVSFHETPQDAASNGTTIPNPAQYININPFVQIIYARAEDNLTHCVSVIPIELDVNPSPKTPVSLVDITVCDTDNNPQDASTRVDLTQLTASVLSQQPLPATAYSVTYYTSLAIAQVGTAPIIPDTNYVGSNGQTIWVRVENNVTHCYNIGTFLLHINTPLLLTTPTPLSLCDDDANPNNQYHTFDLTVKNAQITQGLLGYTVTYYPSLLEAQTHTNPITTPTAYQNDLLHPAVQTLGVVVSSPAPANCESITTLDIRVLPIPTPNTNPAALAPKCDDNNPGDMLEYFDLTVNESYIRNNDPNLSFHYFPTQADAENNIVANEILTPTNALVGTNVWIRVENTRVDYQGNHCYVLVEQALKVNPLPTVVQPLAPYRVCDNDTDGLAPFDLTNPLLAPQILGAAQATTDFTISYYLTAAGANPLTNTGQLPLVSPYTNVTANSQNIYIRVVNNTTGCTNTGVLTLAVEQYATATGPQTFAECDNYNDPYDGIHQIDLTQYATAILNGQSPTVFLVSYYTSLADATAGTNALTLAQAQAYQTDPDTDTIWVKVENSSNTITPLCYAITTIDITVERYPNPIIVTNNGVNTICVDFDTNAVVRPLTLDSGIANPGNYTFEWFEDAATTPIAGATGPTYTVNTSSATGATRNYTVHVTSNSTLACDTTSASFAVIQSGQASIPTGTIGYTVTNAFTEQQIITVLIQGYGTYEYSLDDGPRQASTIFDSVSLGTHVIHVWDTEGGIAYSCEELVIEDVQIIDYPHYFTPNGDGIHDTWNIVGLGGQPDARIYIFDRYGKLLKQISSTGDGWDGTFNGHLLPSDDYWFSVDYIENATAKQFKAHFTLKR
ncbi:T9SS type B sorting domain-containing protein [Flavobacterium sp. N1994]|uniref:T9SS type B sorting domain-containing protein n=1 Tax=Flavobacterium sp. N1994 TaxID=2986827 RepID=UPI0022228078|nr:T9SS type B sorting domain-containing protein [Flavobacterium sp. N1994]